MRIKGIKIDEDVARIFNEQDNDDTSKYRVYYTNESINEDYEWHGPVAKVTFDNGDVIETAINGTDEEIKSYYMGKTFNLGIEEDDMHKVVKVEVIRESKNKAGLCTWHAWQEGKKYACIEDCPYGHIDDFIGMEEDIERFVKAGWVNANGEIVIPAGAEFQVRNLHTPNGIILYFPDVDMELDNGLDEDDNTLYEIINESKNEGFISPAEERQIFQCFIRCGQDIDKTIETLRLAATRFEEADIRKVCAYAYVDLASEDWFTKHPDWEEDMPLEAYKKILKDAEEILGEKLRDDYYVESAKKTNEQDNNFPKGSFAAWYGKDLSGRTYKGGLSCSHENLTSLFGCPSIVTGYFICSYNKLTSLEGAPKKVGGDFNCFGNDLTSLEGSPKEVGGNFNCSDNPITSLEGSPEKVGGDFECYDSRLTSLVGAPEKVERDFNCFGNDLTSLEGSPKKVGGHFDCSYNQLTSLKGAPKEVGGDFDCFDNQLTSLEGSPKEVGGHFDCSYNQLTSLEGIGEVKGEIYS